MARAKSSFICQGCGAVYSRWQGRCDKKLRRMEHGGGGNHRLWRWRGAEIGNCRRAASGACAAVGRNRKRLAGRNRDRRTRQGDGRRLRRRLGGAGRRRSGIGKSTLLLQGAAALAARGKRVVYVSGEEAVAQVRLRAAARTGRSAGGTAERNQRRDHPRHAATGARPRPRHHRFRSRRCGPNGSKAHRAR